MSKSAATTRKKARTSGRKAPKKPQVGKASPKLTKASKPASRSRKPSKRPNKAQKPPKGPDSPSELQFRGLIEPDFPFIDALLGQMKAGKTTATVAARFLGVAEEIFAQWLGIGKRDAETGLRSLFAYLHSVVDAGDAGIEIEIVQNIAASRDWRGLAWLAERRWPLRYDGAMIRLNLMKPPPSSDKVEPWDWTKQTPLLPERIVANLMEFERLIVGGQMLLCDCPENPHDPNYTEPGIRSAVAGALLGDIERGVPLSEDLMRQIREHFEKHPFVPPPQENTGEPESASQNEAVSRSILNGEGRSEER